jgi:hypothetical protein
MKQSEVENENPFKAGKGCADLARRNFNFHFLGEKRTFSKLLKFQLGIFRRI